MKNKKNVAKKILKDNFCNRILLKINRAHPESTGIKLLEKELEAERVNHGKSLSYIAELEDEIGKIKNMSSKEILTANFESQCYKELVNTKAELNQVKKDAAHWKKKFLDLLPKTVVDLQKTQS